MKKTIGMLVLMAALMLPSLVLAAYPNAHLFPQNDWVVFNEKMAGSLPQKMVKIYASLEQQCKVLENFFDGGKESAEIAAAVKAVRKMKVIISGNQANFRPILQNNIHLLNVALEKIAFNLLDEKHIHSLKDAQDQYNVAKRLFGKIIHDDSTIVTR